MRTYEGEFTIEQPREKVWDFITDANKVGPCVPDLIELNVENANRFSSRVKVGVGPIRGKFDLAVELSEVEPGSVMAMTVKGGGMGSGVDMKAEATLSDVEGGTLLKWRADTSISGPIASLGGRLIDNEARKIIEKVFANLKTALDASA
ncbi:MAG: carbon monoxide dehydrogenase subunit G [Hydrogenibacillus sp.]|nr:carbon monoxide dehydrogenase subunit G [Hydrogenibacillus sp.]